ncbi:MAG: hypothetical protein MJ166_08065 [Clostridia bacterium]|nr:hypothetical protein [Clostridia bacterium]
MKFVGIRRVFSTQNEEQYITIGEFWNEMSIIYGIENLMGLGCNWTKNSIEYVMALKNGIIEGSNFEIELPDEWEIVKGRTEELDKIYDEIYKDGSLLYEIEEFDAQGNCTIRYTRQNEPRNAN